MQIVEYFQTLLICALMVHMERISTTKFQMRMRI